MILGSRFSTRFQLRVGVDPAKPSNEPTPERLTVQASLLGCSTHFDMFICFGLQLVIKLDAKLAAAIFRMFVDDEF